MFLCFFLIWHENNLSQWTISVLKMLVVIVSEVIRHIAQLYFRVIFFFIKLYTRTLPVHGTPPTFPSPPIPQPKKVWATMAMGSKCIIPWCQGSGPMVLSYCKSLHKPISTIHLLRAVCFWSWKSLASSWQSDRAVLSWWLFGGR